MQINNFLTKSNFWIEKETFLKHLKAKQFLASCKKNNNIDTTFISLSCRFCRTCKNCKHELDNKIFSLYNFEWPAYLYHFIDKHNFKPNSKFYSFVYEYFSPHKRTGSYIAFSKQIQNAKLILGIGNYSEVSLVPGTNKDYAIVSYTRFKY